jgi:hypothetical protein
MTLASAAPERTFQAPRRPRNGRVGVGPQRDEVLLDPPRRGVGAHQALRRVQHRGCAAEAVVQGVVAAAGSLVRETLDAFRGGVTEGVQALVVVASGEELRAAGGHPVHEPQIHRVEVLELVDDQVLDLQQLDRIQRARVHTLHATRDDLAREHARVQLRSRAVEAGELHALVLADQRVRRNHARRVVLTGCAVRLVIAPDLLRALDAVDPDGLAEFGLEDVAQLPLGQHHRVRRVRGQRVRLPQDSQGQRVQRARGYRRAGVEPAIGACPGDPPLKIPGRGTRERDRHDHARLDAAFEQPAHPLFDRRRLASPGPGDHPHVLALVMSGRVLRPLGLLNLAPAQCHSDLSSGCCWRCLDPTPPSSARSRPSLPAHRRGGGGRPRRGTSGRRHRRALGPCGPETSCRAAGRAGRGRSAPP